MSDKDTGSKVMGALQALQLAVTVGLAVLGYQLNRDAEQAKQAMARIDAGLKARQEDRASAQASDNLRVVLFEQVSKAIASKDERQLRAAQALVTALVPAEQPFRLGLLQALEKEAPPAVKLELGKTVQVEREFQALQSNVGMVPAAATLPQAGAAPPLRLLDVFHCTGVPGAAEKLASARRIETAMQGQASTVRLRAWGESLNASPGYGVLGLQIRHNDDELEQAQALATRLKQATGMDASLRRVSSPTPGYLSVFVC